MASSEAANGKIRLSSDWVSMYRVGMMVFGVTATMFGVIFAAFAVMDLTPDWSSYLPAFGIVGLMDLLAWYGFQNMKDVFYSKQFLYVETIFRKEIHDLKKVRRLNGFYHARDITFEIEFYYEKGSILKIEYIPPYSERQHYIWRDEFAGRALAFQNMLKELHSQK
jgi:hypothetical protein